MPFADVVNWKNVQSFFAWTGAWLDVYVFGTDAEAWQRLLEGLRSHNFVMTYLVDGEIEAVPDTAAQAFAQCEQAYVCLCIQTGRLRINCHFFTRSEIEFDIDPREVTRKEAFADLLVFLRFVGQHLQRRVVMIPEGGRLRRCWRISPTPITGGMQMPHLRLKMERHRHMEDEIKWIYGDGGPTVVLQTSAALQWQGAADFDNSLMQGGSVETDYDVICRCEGGVTVLERYSRDMLVLDDCEWASCFVPSTAGEVVILQWYGSDSEVDELISQLTAAAPSETFAFTMRDTALRLLVGADDGNGRLYGFSDVMVSPGGKTCEVYRSEEAQIVVLRPATAIRR